MKVLNLYAGIGGNRKLWEGVEVTAVERNRQIAKLYQEFYPDDLVITKNAHKFLLDNYENYHFIWSSPPCPTHSRMNHLTNVTDTKRVKYPNMMLYQEIILLNQFFKGKWVVENVISYYDPLIKPYQSENHYFWSNFNITYRKPIDRIIKAKLYSNKWGFDLDQYNLPNTFKNKVLNNLCNPYLGLHIFKCAFKEKQIALDNFHGQGGVMSK